MLAEFHQLFDKVRQLAELAGSLRRENADLRRQISALAAENAELNQRMQQAHQRVSALLEQIPLPEQNEEAA